MTPEVGDEITSDRIDRRFVDLSRPDKKGPISFRQSELRAMRQQLVDSGCNFDIDLVVEGVLLQTEFRDLDSGRGPAAVAILGQEKAEKLLVYCRELREGGPRIIGESTGEPIKDSEGRGERQVALHLLAAAYYADDLAAAAEFLLRANRNLWRGAWISATSPEDKVEVNRAFGREDGEKPSRRIASALSENIGPLWVFLTGREIEQ